MEVHESEFHLSGIVIPQLITNPFGDDEETDVILQEKLIQINTI